MYLSHRNFQTKCLLNEKKKRKVCKNVNLQFVCNHIYKSLVPGEIIETLNLLTKMMLSKFDILCLISKGKEFVSLFYIHKKKK